MIASRTLSLSFIVPLIALFFGAQQSHQDNDYKQEIVCGTLDQLSDRVEVCMKPVMDIIQGTVERWPRNNSDIKLLCEEIIDSEKCIREHGRKCSKGLHRTVISTMATSIQRSRKRECMEKNQAQILRTVNCVEKNQLAMSKIISNVTSYMKVVEKEFPTPEKKTHGVCCLVTDLAQTINTILRPKCPGEVDTVLRLYQSIVRDVQDLLCRSAKCQNIFKGYRVKQVESNKITGLPATMLRIVFSLDG